MTTAISLFGNESFFHIAANSNSTTHRAHPPAIMQICQTGHLPFASSSSSSYFFNLYSTCSYTNTDTSNISPNGPDQGADALTDLLISWIYGFINTSSSNQALSAAMFFSNRASLTQTVANTYDYSAREIFSSPGTLVSLPYKSLAGTVVVSVLLVLQVLGIACLALFIYRVPTWSHSLDAVAVARLGATVDRADLPTLNAGTEVDTKTQLVNANGLIGLSDESTPLNARIQLGGPGLAGY